MSIYLSANISPEAHAPLLPIFVHVAYGRGSVLLWQGDEIPREWAILGFFFPTDNELYSNSIAFGTHTKTAKPVEMPFWIKLGWDQGTMY